MVAIAREYAAEKEGQLPSDSALVQDCRRALRSSESEAWGGLAIAWEGGNHFFPVVDGRQNIVGYLNTGGNWKQTVELDAFGNTINDSGTVSFPFGYKGYFRDLDTGMYYLGHRYYNPLTGRFLNRDPIREAGGLNLYAHTANDHINRWDFLGLSDADQYEDAKSGDHLQRRSSSFLGFDFTLYGFSHGDWLFRRYHAQNRAYENWLGERRIPIHIGSGTLRPNFRNPILRHSQQEPGGSFDGLRDQGGKAPFFVRVEPIEIEGILNNVTVVVAGATRVGRVPLIFEEGTVVDGRAVIGPVNLPIDGRIPGFEIGKQRGNPLYVITAQADGTFEITKWEGAIAVGTIMETFRLGNIPGLESLRGLGVAAAILNAGGGGVMRTTGGGITSEIYNIPPGASVESQITDIITKQLQTIESNLLAAEALRNVQVLSDFDGSLRLEININNIKVNPAP